jgi:hypothetical protein
LFTLANDIRKDLDVDNDYLSQMERLELNTITNKLVHNVNELVTRRRRHDYVPRTHGAYIYELHTHAQALCDIVLVHGLNGTPSTVLGF